MSRLKLEVYPMDDGECLVRGAQDPVLALELIVHDMDEYDTDDLLHGVAPDPHYGQTDPEAVQAVADWCHSLLARARPGIYRKNPVAPGSAGEFEGWSWQLGYAKQTGHGAFEGVYFREW